MIEKHTKYSPYLP